MTFQDLGLIYTHTHTQFHNFPGLENLNFKFHDFPGSACTLKIDDTLMPKHRCRMLPPTALTHTSECLVTFTLIHQNSRPNQFTCHLNYIINHSLVTFWMDERRMHTGKHARTKKPQNNASSAPIDGVDE